MAHAMKKAFDDKLHTIRLLFDEYDEEGLGTIGQGEVVLLFRRLGYPPDHITRIFNDQIDSDGDGRMSLRELLDFVERHQEEMKDIAILDTGLRSNNHDHVHDHGHDTPQGPMKYVASVLSGLINGLLMFVFSCVCATLIFEACSETSAYTGVGVGAHTVCSTYYRYCGCGCGCGGGGGGGGTCCCCCYARVHTDDCGAALVGGGRGGCLLARVS